MPDVVARMISRMAGPYFANGVYGPIASQWMRTDQRDESVRVAVLLFQSEKSAQVARDWGFLVGRVFAVHPRSAYYCECFCCRGGVRR